MQVDVILNDGPHVGQTSPRTIYMAETEWTRRQAWRRPNGDEAERGRQVREALTVLSLYPQARG